MTNILINGKKYTLFSFENEQEFETAVIDNSEFLFGKETVYIDIKKRMGEKDSYHKGVPDGYLIDFSNKKQPQLYFVENELSTHDVYNHIAEQLVRFITSTRTSVRQIRSKLTAHIKKDKKLLDKINNFLKNSIFTNIDELMLFLTEKNKIRIVVAIDEETTDFNFSLDALRDRPDVVILQRYSNKDEIVYQYQPMREEIESLGTIRKEKDAEELDTVVCAAFEDGFRHAYIQNNAWWAIRLSQKAREQLRYLAIYEKSPKAVIQHVAEIEKIEPYKDSGKYIVYLKNKKKIKPIPLDKNKKGVAPQSPRYTTYDKLTKANKISDLW